MRKLFQWLGLILLYLIAAEAVGQVRPVVIYESKETKLVTASPFGESRDLWVTLADLKRATGFVVKPQGVCRAELCFPLPKQRKGDFLAKHGKVTWFNLSEFGRLLNQPLLTIRSFPRGTSAPGWRRRTAIFPRSRRRTSLCRI